MTQIQTAFVKATNFIQMEKVLKYVKEDVSFFGRRYFTMHGCEGSLPIDALALKVMKLVSEKKEFSQPEEQNAFKIAVLQVNHIYELNDRRWKNPLTLLFLTVRDKWNCYKFYFNNSKDIRHMWKAYNFENFNFFDKNFPTFHDKFLPYLTNELIESVFDNIYTTKKLLEFAKKAKEEISFFGHRHIYILDYEGTLPIEAFASKVRDIVKGKLYKSPDEEELEAFVDELHLSNDKRKMEKNVFTRFTCYLRDVSGKFITYKYKSTFPEFPSKGILVSDD